MLRRMIFADSVTGLLSQRNRQAALEKATGDACGWIDQYGATIEVVQIATALAGNSAFATVFYLMRQEAAASPSA